MYCTLYFKNSQCMIRVWMRLPRVVRNEMVLANVILRRGATKNLNLRASNEEIASPAARNDMSVGQGIASLPSNGNVPGQCHSEEQGDEESQSPRE